MLNQFERFIAKYQLQEINQPILVAVSGGIDSVVLCHHMHAAGVPFAIAHVNFGLRGGESDADDIFVAGLAETYEVAHHRKFVDTNSYAAEFKVSIQMAARTIRYDWFNELIQEHDYHGVAVGTHLNDQIETAILNLTKETGLSGLTGIQEHRDRIYRPLIQCSRKEIEAYAEQHELAWRSDSSNNDTHYQRNLIRHAVLPVLEKINPALERSFNKSFEHLKQVEEFVTYQANQILERALQKKPDQESIKKSLVEHPSNQYILYHWLKPYGFSADQIRNIINAQQGARFYNSKQQVLTVERSQFILFYNAESDITDSLTIHEDMREFSLGKYTFTTEIIPVKEYEVVKDSAYGQLDYDKLRFPLTVRTWKRGDRIKPLGMNGFKKVSDVWIDAKASHAEKTNTPIWLSGEQLVWISGYMLSNDLRIAEDTKNVYLIRIKSFQ